MGQGLPPGKQGDGQRSPNSPFADQKPLPPLQRGVLGGGSLLPGTYLAQRVMVQRKEVLWVRLTQIHADIYWDIYSVSAQHPGPGAPLPPHAAQCIGVLLLLTLGKGGNEASHPAANPTARCLWDTRGQQQLLSTWVSQGQL